MKKQEILDIVNERDEVIGTATREECHNNPNLMHRVVHFTLYNNTTKKILFSKLPPGKKRDQGMNVFLGEHVRSNETYVDALKRGVNEELGFIPTHFKDLGTHLFMEEDETEKAEFFLVSIDKEEIHTDITEVLDEWWLDAKRLNEFDDNVGPITRYWIDNIEWDKVL
jgi:isopentenyldiphosphate isomerase